MSFTIQGLLIKMFLFQIMNPIIHYKESLLHMNFQALHLYLILFKKIG